MRRRKNIITWFLLVALIVCSFLPATDIRAAEEGIVIGNSVIRGDIEYSIQNAYSTDSEEGWFMNVKGAGKSNGTVINLWPLDMSEPISQRFKFNIVDSQNRIVKISPSNGNFLDVRRNGKAFVAGQGIVIWEEDYDPLKELSYVTVEDDFWINGAVMPTELSSIKELIEKGNGKITIDGNEYYAVWGETGAFIWRYVEATFDSLAHYVSTFIVDENPLENMCLFEGNIYRTEFRKYDADEWQWYLGDYVQKEVRVTHIGEDMFEIQESNSGAWSIEEWKNKVILNGPDDYMFSLDTIGLPDFRIWDSDYFYLRSMHRQNQYSDDYVCMKIEYYDPWYYLKGRYEYVYIWLDKYGNYQYVNLEKYIWDEDTGIGSYSDGVFYCDGRFFDFYLNVILDIQEQGYEPYVGTDYSPKFVDGICTMIAKKNGKYWMFDIDKSGNIISDIEEVDI